MVRRRQTTRRKKKKTPRPGWFATNIRTIVIVLALFALLIFSVLSVAYVIFFRTVFA